MADAFSSHRSSLESPFAFAADVTPSDADAMPAASRALYVGGGGDLRVTMVGGETVTFAAVPTPSLFPIRVTRVHATGTTATDIVALW